MREKRKGERRGEKRREECVKGIGGKKRQHVAHLCEQLKIGAAEYIPVRDRAPVQTQRIHCPCPAVCAQKKKSLSRHHMYTLWTKLPHPRM